jgi:hypothetical protein
MASSFGVAHCTLHVISEAPSTNFTTKVLTTYADKWISRYIDRRYSFLDPVARACHGLDRGFFWSELDRETPILRGFWADAAAHGVGPAGYTRPILTERGDRLAISLASAEDDESFRDRIYRLESDIFNLGIFLSETFCRLASEDRPPSFNPTDDQLLILRAIAMGADEAELSARSYQYGSWNTLERSICALFRSRTVAQAAVLAARIGILANAPLTRADVLTASAAPHNGGVASTGLSPRRPGGTSPIILPSADVEAIGPITS